MLIIFLFNEEPLAVTGLVDLFSAIVFIIIKNISTQS